MKRILLTGLVGCFIMPAVFATHVIVDGKNNLQINGQIATALEMGTKQDAETSYAQKKLNEVKINTANLSFQGTIEENLVYRLRLRFAPQTTEATSRSTYSMIDYALAGYSFMPELTVVMGKVDVGGGFDYQSSAMSPLTFAQDLDYFFGSGTANGVRAFGTVFETIDWSLTAVNGFDVNGTTKYQASNDNNSFDYVAMIAHHSKDAADAEGYNAEGDFKHYVSFDYARLNNGKEPHRSIIATTGFFSYQNAILHAAQTTEVTPNRKDDFWTLGAGYLINKTWRPSVTYSTVRSESLLYVKGKHSVLAANLTNFHANNKWRNYFEISTTSKSDEAKRAVTAASHKDEKVWKASIGLTVNI